MTERPNYTVGAGKVYLAYNDDAAFGERYVGSSPGFSINLNVETITIYESVNGVIMPGGTEIIRVSSSCMLSLDDISRDNLMTFMMSSRADVQVSSDVHTKTIRLAPGSLYDLGVKALRDLSATSEGRPFDLSVFDIDGQVGLIRLREDADVYFGQEVVLTFIGDGISHLGFGGPLTPYKGPLRYVEDNLTGENRVLYVPNVGLYPDSEMDLKASSWRTLALRAEVTSMPLWIERELKDDYNIGDTTEDFGANLSSEPPAFTDDYGVQ